MSGKTYYVNGAPPGWSWCMSADCRGGVGLAASTARYERRWQWRTTNTTVGRHALGLPSFPLDIEPLDADEGTIYVAEMRMDLLATFDGVAGSGGGGSSGSCAGDAAFAYGGELSPTPFYGDGGGTGGGGRPGERVHWQFRVQARHVLEVSNVAEQAGLSTASYIDPALRQCDSRACGARPFGICERVCRNETAGELSGLAWVGVGASAGNASALPMCSYEVPANEGDAAAVPPFESLTASLDVNLSFTYRFRAIPSPPLPPLSPPLPPQSPPPTPSPVPLSPSPCPPPAPRVPAPPASPPDARLVSAVEAPDSLLFQRAAVMIWLAACAVALVVRERMTSAPTVKVDPTGTLAAAAAATAGGASAGVVGAEGAASAASPASVPGLALTELNPAAYEAAMAELNRGDSKVSSPVQARVHAALDWGDEKGEEDEPEMHAL